MHLYPKNNFDKSVVILVLILFSFLISILAFKFNTEPNSGIEYGGMFIVENGKAYIKGNTEIDGSITTSRVTDLENQYKHASFLYIIDSSVSDQASQESGSIKYLLDFIGPQKSTFLLSSEAGETNYYIKSNLIIPDNVYLRVENGAVIHIDTNITMFLNSPDNLIASEKQLVKSGDGFLKFLKDGNIYPGWWGISSTQDIDYTNEWNEINSSIASNSVLNLFPNAFYLINTPGGIVFSKSVQIKGNNSTFYAGANLGNNPLLSILSENSILSDFSVDCSANHYDIDGNMVFQNPNDNLENHKRRGILVAGDSVECSGLTLKNCVVGISFEALKGGSINHCEFINEFITGGTTLANNYHAAILLVGAINSSVHNNYIFGHGQGILVGEKGPVGFLDIYTNTLENQSNNGIYISSGECCSVFQNTISGFDGSGIKTRGDNHEVSGNRVRGTQDLAVAGISMTGNGPGQNGFNAETGYIRDNKVCGNVVTGILVNKTDGASIKAVRIQDNNIDFDPNMTEEKRAIAFVRCKSFGATITGNKGTNHDYFILFSVEDANTEYHESAIISQNIGPFSNRDSLAAQNLTYSSVTDNQFFNSGQNASCIAFSKCTYNKISINDLSDYRTPTKQAYSVESFDGSNYNMYYYNLTWNLPTKDAYHGIGNKSEIFD